MRRDNVLSKKVYLGISAFYKICVAQRRPLKALSRSMVVWGFLGKFWNSLTRYRLQFPLSILFPARTARDPRGTPTPFRFSPRTTHSPPLKWISFANRTLRHFLAGTHQDQRPNLGGFLQIQALLNGGGPSNDALFKPDRHAHVA